MHPKLLLCLSLVLSSLSTHARAVRLWSDADLTAASDLVVIAMPLVTKDLDETNSLGWAQSETFRPKFRGVETTFKVYNVLKGMPANDRIVLHHYRYEIEWGSPPNDPDFIDFTQVSTNKLLLYLFKDGTNRYAPVSGQIDSSLSVRPLPANHQFNFDMPALPPIADANPAIRCPVQVRIPVRLQADLETNSINIETAETVVTNLTVGTNMVTGTECETKVYQGGKLLNIGGTSLQGGLADGSYHDHLPLHFEKSLKLDESFTAEITITMFETDEPAQHFWSPQSGPKYQVLWKLTSKLVVK